MLINVEETVWPDEWRTVPLCSRYVVVHFNPLCEPGGAKNRVACVPAMWALGVLVDGQQELLGAWLVPAEGGSAWSDALGELWARGIEQIAWAVVPGQPAPPAVGKAGSPRIGRWHDESHLMAPDLVLSPGTTRVMAKAGDVAQRLEAAMTRAARRRGGQFVSAESAFACLGRQWRRLERQLGAERAGQPHWSARPGPLAYTGAGAASGPPAP